VSEDETNDESSILTEEQYEAFENLFKMCETMLIENKASGRGARDVIERARTCVSNTVSFTTAFDDAMCIDRQSLRRNVLYNSLVAALGAISGSLLALEAIDLD